MFQTHKRKFSVALSIITIATVCIAYTKPATIQPKAWKNLKVLPKNISHDSLDYLMDAYKFGLGIKCGYCHVRGKDNKMNMASDENPIKDIARKMILMTNEMNEKYIRSINHPPTDTTALQLVTCNTCHSGQTKPIVAVMPAKK